MKKRKYKKMWIAIWAAVSVTLGAAVFFRIPYSPAHARFQKAADEITGAAAEDAGVFTEEDIEHLPPPVRRYFRHCGYLGKPKMPWMKASLSDVDFVMSESRTIRIDYRQINLASRPERYAFISSSLFGIPFEGLDSYENGAGSMRGTLAKVIRLFDQRGEAMDRACLVTWLAESLMVPSAALSDFITWEPVDDTRAKAVISWKGVTAGGVFSFSETGELLAFRTGDRTAVDMNGREREAEWSALFLKYHPVNGILQPGVIQSVWHYPEGDCLYFNQNKAAVAIEYP